MSNAQQDNAQPKKKRKKTNKNNNKIIGSLTFADGGNYEGECKGGLPNGQGTYTYSDGNKYVGEFKDGYRYGQGRMTYVDGDVYEGAWYEGAGRWKGDEPQWKKGTWTWANGQGTWTWANGTTYEGAWTGSEDHEPHGQGTWTCADGSIYVGEFKDGYRYGQGRMTYVGGDVYEGAWKGDEPHGQGTWTCADGDVYDGKWKDGKKHGYGIQSEPDGYEYKGIWHRNRKVAGLGFGAIKKNKADVTCAICLDTEEDTEWCRLECCRQTFHLCCIGEWHNCSENKDCPCCRELIEMLTRVINYK